MSSRSAEGQESDGERECDSVAGHEIWIRPAAPKVLSRAVVAIEAAAAVEVVVDPAEQDADDAEVVSGVDRAAS